MESNIRAGQQWPSPTMTAVGHSLRYLVSYADLTQIDVLDAVDLVHLLADLGKAETRDHRERRRVVRRHRRDEPADAKRRPRPLHHRTCGFGGIAAPAIRQEHPVAELDRRARE